MSEFLTVPQLLRHVADNIEAGRPDLEGLQYQCDDGSFENTGLIKFGDVADRIKSGDLRYRIKPATRVINGFEVPEPVREALKYSRKYFYPSFESIAFFETRNWNDCSSDRTFLYRGLVFLNAYDAIATAKAMLGIDPNS
jgi:hypothetical protein